MYLICNARDRITETELLGRLDVCLTPAKTTGCMCHQYACTSSNGLLWICTWTYCSYPNLSNHSV